MAQLLWFKRVRQNLKVVFVIAVLINIGMWFERFTIIVGSLYQDFLPANWGYYKQTWVDVGTYLGTLGAFFMMYLLFIRFLPMIPVAEVKSVRRPTASSLNSIHPPRFCRRRRKSATPDTTAGTCSRRFRFTASTR
jgi:molybdopterin-containing oxidoreductase family membrane subunit